jgi:hypothetical protein
MGEVRANRFRIASALAATLGLAGCWLPEGFDPRMGVAVFYTADNLCSRGVSPRIRVNNVPDAAAGFLVRIQNISVLFSKPQDFAVEGSQPEFPVGALSGYQGPCPGEQQRFDMRVEVVALDAGGRRIAFGTVRRTVGSTSSMLTPER